MEETRRDGKKGKGKVDVSREHENKSEKGKKKNTGSSNGLSAHE